MEMVQAFLFFFYYAKHILFSEILILVKFKLHVCIMQMYGESVLFIWIYSIHDVILFLLKMYKSLQFRNLHCHIDYFRLLAKWNF